MGQVCPKDSKELHSSLLSYNKKIKQINKEEMCKRSSKEDSKPCTRYLSPEKARDTATWIMSTW